LERGKGKGRKGKEREGKKGRMKEREE